MAFNIRITGPVEKPGIVVTGEQRELFNWNRDAGAWGTGPGQIMDRIQNGWVQTNGQSAPRPKSIYCVSGDLPWGDQSYERYGLAQMQTVKRVVSAQIVQERLSPYSIIADTWRNSREVPEGRNSDDYKVGFQTGQDYSLTNSVETSWNAQVTAGSSATVSVEVGGDAMGGKVGVSQTMSLEVSAGTGGRKEQDEAVGVNRSVSAELYPGEATDVVIVSQKGDLVASVVYETLVEGYLWIDMGRRVDILGKGAHNFFFEPVQNHFWPLRQVQTIDVDFYNKSDLELRPHS